MCTRVLRRPLVFLRIRCSMPVRCSILILLIETVRCNICSLQHRSFQDRLLQHSFVVASFAVAFVRCIRCSMRSLQHSFVASLAIAFVRWSIRSLQHSFVVASFALAFVRCSICCSIRSFQYQFVASFAIAFVRCSILSLYQFVSSFATAFVRWSIRSLQHSLHLSRIRSLYSFIVISFVVAYPIVMFTVRLLRVCSNWWWKSGQLQR